MTRGGEYERCGANGVYGPCKNGAGKNTDHPGIGRCAWHGGATRTQRRAARRQMIVMEAEAMGLPRDVDPATAIMEALHKAAGQVDWYEAEVNALDSPWLEETTQFGDKVYAHPAVVGYVKALDQLYSYSERTLKLDLFSRQVQADELQAAMLARLVMEILDSPELGLSHEQREQGRRIGGRKLRELASPKAG